jgi:hypothetical protein
MLDSGLTDGLLEGLRESSDYRLIDRHHLRMLFYHSSRMTACFQTQRHMVSLFAHGDIVALVKPLDNVLY